MSLTVEAFERIRNAIVSGGLEFGEQLSETQIAKALGMSKAPVRAAFMELRDKGLVTIIPQSGTYVFSPTPEDVRTLSQFRALLEEEAIREAMKRKPQEVVAKLEEAVARMRKALAGKDYAAYGEADSAFHLAILEAAGNRYLIKAYALSSTALEALRARLQRGGFRARSYDEHVEMARLLKNGKIDKASRLMRVHILVINDSLHLLSEESTQSARRPRSAPRDYGAVFGGRAGKQPQPGRRKGAATATPR
jgi:DNA-binding GntR family transcriptional regulator